MRVRAVAVLPRRRALVNVNDSVINAGVAVAVAVVDSANPAFAAVVASSVNVEEQRTRGHLVAVHLAEVPRNPRQEHNGDDEEHDWHRQVRLLRGRRDHLLLKRPWGTRARRGDGRRHRPRPRPR